MLGAMVAWKDVEAAAPEFAARVRRIFDAHKHKTIATIRADGGPRISGIEAEFAGGELTFGSMPGARKGADLHRDPRFALHSPSVDPPEGDPAGWAGDAKIAGRAVPAGEVGGDTEGELFRADVHEVVRTGLDDEATMLVIEIWTPGGGLRRVERA
ncbi:pyridoxamine 5'-phosphate oxidase [Pseudonocardia kunmingensis]|uniref:Pyridoxamine 5'-phosphate oxidase n=2 Tax=Pseudonocardia kunmingensis TaxID=630975 RepID=A0A543D9B2_9PSEU|nr:pyridoxamine 5'-phosphate oxidase [Pseudonocardia kunmingensis]